MLSNFSHPEYDSTDGCLLQKKQRKVLHTLSPSLLASPASLLPGWSRESCRQAGAWIKSGNHRLFFIIHTKQWKSGEKQLFTVAWPQDCRFGTLCPPARRCQQLPFFLERTTKDLRHFRELFPRSWVSRPLRHTQ